MKGRMAVGATVILLLAAVAAWGGPLELYFGAGPSLATLGAINNGVIQAFNVLITELDTEPTITGTVTPLRSLGTTISYQAGERYWLSDRFGLSGGIDFAHMGTATSGSYSSSSSAETSSIDVALGCSTIGFIVSGRYTFLDAGIQLSADLGFGYYLVGFNSDITFQIPSDYPPLSISPTQGKGSYHGSSYGIQGGLILGIPVTSSLGLNICIGYRSLVPAAMTDAQGQLLDLDGDGSPEPIDLSGINVRFDLSLKFGLPF
jgi:hypothetical protein